MNLGNGVLGPALRAEAVTARLEIRLKDGLQHQLQRSLHRPVDSGRYPEATDLAVGLRNQLLAHPLGRK